MQDTIKKDWRDRTSTKVAAGILAGALIIGSAYGLKRAFEYQRGQFCQQYSWLKSHSASVQKKIASELAQDMAYSDSDRIAHADNFLRKLRNCSEVKIW